MSQGQGGRVTTREYIDLPMWPHRGGPNADLICFIFRIRTVSMNAMPYILISAFCALAVNGCTNTTAQSSAKTDFKITSIYWSDGDSGRLNGDLKFRLNDVDAPETGGVGAAIGGAKCELERERAYASKEWIVTFTKNAALEITESYGDDRYDRLVIDLSADGQDVGQAGIDAGHLAPWPHDGRKALAKRPVWCLTKSVQ